MFLKQNLYNKAIIVFSEIINNNVQMKFTIIGNGINADVDKINCMDYWMISQLWQFLWHIHNVMVKTTYSKLILNLKIFFWQTQ